MRRLIAAALATVEGGARSVGRSLADLHVVARVPRIPAVQEGPTAGRDACDFAVSPGSEPVRSWRVLGAFDEQAELCRA